MDKNSLERRARELYREYASNHPTIHCNRFPPWSELLDSVKEQWRQRAALSAMPWRVEQRAAPQPRQVDYMKLSQDAANEIWSVVLKSPGMKTPNVGDEYVYARGAAKRAIEREIRGALETALGLPSTVDGHEEGVDPLYGESSTRPAPNLYHELMVASAEVLKLERSQGVTDDEMEAALERLDIALTALNYSH